MGSDTILDAKQRVSRRFLGQAGIHGIGLHPDASDTITVYRSPCPGQCTSEADQMDGPEAAFDDDPLVEELRREAHPFKIEVHDDDAPEI